MPEPPADAPARFTEATTAYWQVLHDSCPIGASSPPYRFSYPVHLPDGRWLALPIRQRADNPTRAVASFIANHAGFSVIEALARHMADQTRERAPDIVVGLPTLGLALAPPLARALGHDRFVPFGTSRKYWYSEDLSADASSITTAAIRRLYVDPNLVPLLVGRRVLLVDDTISSGTTTLAALGILHRVGAEVIGCAFAMSQGDHWRTLLGARAPEVVDLVTFVFQTPLLQMSSARDGWTPVSV